MNIYTEAIQGLSWPLLRITQKQEGYGRIVKNRQLRLTSKIIVKEQDNYILPNEGELIAKL
jgi:hypothetical protein